MVILTAEQHVSSVQSFVHCPRERHVPPSVSQIHSIIWYTLFKRYTFFFPEKIQRNSEVCALCSSADSLLSTQLLKADSKAVREMDRFTCLLITSFILSTYYKIFSFGWVSASALQRSRVTTYPHRHVQMQRELV